MANEANPATLPKIFAVRRQRVVLDSDLAALFGVGTKVFNQAIRRNQKRFPGDFAFQLTPDELAVLRSQNATSKSEKGDSLRSQSVTLKKGRRGRHSKYPPWVFTEHGAIMAAMLLHSDHAVVMSVYVVRAFVRMRDEILANVAILKRLAEIDRRLLEHDVVLREVIERLQPLINAPAEGKLPKRKIGFHQGNR
jgi:ORF6N domain